jgi:hypothetical protein
MHISDMSKHRRHLAAVLCVLLLNLQLFAANALGCVHGETASALIDCPHAAMGAAADAGSEGRGPATPEPSASEPCQKCNLGTVAAGWHLFGVDAPTLVVRQAGLPPAAVPVTLPTRSPHGLLRPPQRISG